MWRGKVTPAKALLHQHKAPKAVKAIFKEVESHAERYELNLYVSGRDEDDAPPAGTEAAK
jgi:succinate dehydrogenase / fumarate reductase iron-sulfur subunit